MNLQLWSQLFPNTIDAITNGVETSFQKKRLRSYLLKHGITVKAIEATNGRGYHMCLQEGNMAPLVGNRIFDSHQLAEDVGFEEAIRSIELHSLVPAHSICEEE